jgi:hypothetical protein
MKLVENSQLTDTQSSNASKAGTVRDLIALSLLAIAIFVYFAPLLLAKSALFYFDVTEINYAYRHYFAENLKAGRFSFWCHQLYNGLPLFAESQAGYFHPLKFMFYPWMSTWAALGFDMVASLALTGLGTYAWLRRHAHSAGALAGALIAVFGGFTWAHFVHTSMVNALAAVPWIIWGLERSWRTGRFGGSAVAAFALSTQVFAGHLQDAVMSIQLIVLMTFFALLFRSDTTLRKRAIIHGGVAILMGVAIAAVQWMPSYDLLKRTPRTEGLTWLDQTFGSWHPQLLPTLFVRESYGTRARDTDWMDGFYPYHEMNAYLGATAMLMALIGSRRWRDPWVGLWVFIGFVSAVFMLGRFTFVMDFWHKIPILGSSRIPVRYHLWATFATAALASQGIDMLIRGRENLTLKKPLLILATFVFAAVVLFAWGMTPWWTESSRWTATYHQERNVWLSDDLIWGGIRSLSIFVACIVISNVAFRSGSKHAREYCAFLIAALIGSDLISAHWNEMPTVDPSYWTSPPPAVATIKADANHSRMMGVARYSAGEPGYASKKIDFFAPRDAMGWSLPLAYGLESNIGETPFRPARLIRLTDLSGGEPWRFSIEGVSHLVTGQPLNPSMVPVKAGSASVYRLAEPEPRFHWARAVEFVRDDVQAEAAVKKLGIENSTGTVVIEAADSKPVSNEVGNQDWTAGIRNSEYGGDSMAFELDASTDKWLRIGVSFDPGWKAWLDGKEILVHPAQLAFMAVKIPQGTHRLQLRYEPVLLRAGGAIAALAVLVTFVLVIGRARIGGEIRDEIASSSTPGMLAPHRLAVILIVILAVSAIGIGDGGKPGVSSRWNDSWHRFTWGAGIEAMTRK